MAIDIEKLQFIKLKEEMDRLGFKSYDEYYDYLDFIDIRNKRSN